MAREHWIIELETDPSWTAEWIAGNIEQEIPGFKVHKVIPKSYRYKVYTDTKQDIDE